MTGPIAWVEQNPKVLLAASQQFSHSSPVHLSCCLGVLALAASLKNSKISCEVLDLYPYHQLGTGAWEDFLESVTADILSAQPDILGFSTMPNTLPLLPAICSRLKKSARPPFILLGGPAVSFCAAEILNAFPQVDAILRGEADFALPAALEVLCGNKNVSTAKGLVIRAPQGIIDNRWPEPVMDLDKLAVPDYAACRSSPALSGDFGDYNGICIEVGRGCPFKCAFCSTSRFFRRKYRVKSPARIIREIGIVFRILGENRIIFNHDLLTCNPAYMQDLCREIKKNYPALKWKCHTRLDTINPPLLALMAEAGCNELFIGIETSTIRMQKMIHKGLDLEEFVPTLKALAGGGFRFSLSFIVGFPGEATEERQTLLDLIFQAKNIAGRQAVIKIHPLAPLGGSELFLKHRKLMDYDAFDFPCAGEYEGGWQTLALNVREHPVIFPMHFYFRYPGGNRELDIKYTLLGFVLETLLPRSLIFAQKLLGDKFVSLLYKLLQELPLPPGLFRLRPAAARFALLLRNRLNTELRKLSLPWQAFLALAELELASAQVIIGRNKPEAKHFQAYYRPEEILAFPETPPGKIPPPRPQPLNLLVSRNQNTQALQYIILPHTALAFLGITS